MRERYSFNEIDSVGLTRKKAPVFYVTGAIIVAVATVVDRDTGAQKVIEDAGYKYFTAVTLDDLELR
jgi:orotate phosphoribosyltransferase